MKKILCSMAALSIFVYENSCGMSPQENSFGNYDLGKYETYPGTTIAKLRHPENSFEAAGDNNNVYPGPAVEEKEKIAETKSESQSKKRRILSGLFSRKPKTDDSSGRKPNNEEGVDESSYDSDGSSYASSSADRSNSGEEEVEEEKGGEKQKNVEGGVDESSDGGRLNNVGGGAFADENSNAKQQIDAEKKEVIAAMQKGGRFFNGMSTIKKYLGKNCQDAELLQEMFYYACEFGRLDVVKYLTDEKNNFSFSTDALCGVSKPLFTAYDGGHEDIVRYLIDNNKVKDLDCTNAHGWTILMAAIYGGKEAFANYLIDKGASLSAKGVTSIGGGVDRLAVKVSPLALAIIAGRSVKLVFKIIKLSLNGGDILEKAMTEDMSGLEGEGRYYSAWDLAHLYRRKDVLKVLRASPLDDSTQQFLKTLKSKVAAMQVAGKNKKQRYAGLNAISAFEKKKTGENWTTVLDRLKGVVGKDEGLKKLQEKVIQEREETLKRLIGFPVSAAMITREDLLKMGFTEKEISAVVDKGYKRPDLKKAKCD